LKSESEYVFTTESYSKLIKLRNYSLKRNLKILPNKTPTELTQTLKSGKRNLVE